MTADAVGARHHLIADDELWRRNRILLLFPALLLLGFDVVGIVVRHVVDTSLLALAAILGVAGGLIYLRRATRYVALVPGGLLLRGGLRRGVVGSDQLRRTRTQTLGSLYEARARRGQLPPTLRRFAGRPVLVVRVDQDSHALGEAARVLGARFVLDRDLVLLVQGAGALEAELTPVVPRRPPGPSMHGPRAAHPSRRRSR